MNFYTLTSTTHPYFNISWNLYESAFPKNEKRTLKEQEQILQKEEYTLLAFFEKESFVGFLGFWKIQEFTFVEHFAINLEFRGQNFGSTVLNNFLSLHQNVVLEIEPPKCKDTKRRLYFYKNLGFVQNRVKHFQVPFRKEDKTELALELLSYKTPIKKEQYKLLYLSMQKLLQL